MKTENGRRTLLPAAVFICGARPRHLNLTSRQEPRGGVPRPSVLSSTRIRTFPRASSALCANCGKRELQSRLRRRQQETLSSGAKAQFSFRRLMDGGPVVALLQVRATERVHEVEIPNVFAGAKITGPGLPWRYNTGVHARRLVAALLTLLMLSVSTWASGGTMPCARTRRCPCCKANSITPPKSPRIGASRQCYSSCGCALQQRDQESAGIFAIRATNEARSTDRLPIAVGIPATSKPSSHAVRIARGAPPPGIVAVDPLLESLRI